jgi:hypothetical protein
MKIQYLSPLLLLLFYHCNLMAQNNAPIIVKAGNTIEGSVPAIDLYEYPQFIHGTVLSRAGNTSGGNMKYNRFLDEMQFITPKGDTFTLINKKDITFIHIGADTFFYDQGYIKLVTSLANVQLGEKQMLRIIDKQKMGAYGMVSSTTAIDSYASYNDGVQIYNMTVMQDLILAREVQYYIGDRYNHFVVANKKNVLELFPKQHKALVNYLKENTVEFNKKEDLVKLVQFVTQLE